MAATPLPRLTLVLGGARSGKSRHAEQLVTNFAPPWIYVATAEARDEEMRARIDAHRQRRSEEWQTLEAPLELAAILARVGGTSRPVLVDCLTLWLSNALLAGRNVESECERLTRALRGAKGPVVVVSNEVGLGIVPDTPLGRVFRDAQGLLNQRVAAAADHVVLMTAGLPLTLKGRR
jgi:adenosylcobinamide kinase/adenosylcobinamide-phosphate guanylyltransferase